MPRRKRPSAAPSLTLASVWGKFGFFPGYSLKYPCPLTVTVAKGRVMSEGGWPLPFYQILEQDVKVGVLVSQCSGGGLHSKELAPDSHLRFFLLFT